MIAVYSGIVNEIQHRTSLLGVTSMKNEIEFFPFAASNFFISSTRNFIHSAIALCICVLSHIKVFPLALL
jgi:hypothetical protein